MFVLCISDSLSGFYILRVWVVVMLCAFLVLWGVQSHGVTWIHESESMEQHRRPYHGMPFAAQCDDTQLPSYTSKRGRPLWRPPESIRTPRCSNRIVNATPFHLTVAGALHKQYCIYVLFLRKLAPSPGGCYAPSRANSSSITFSSSFLNSAFGSRSACPTASVLTSQRPTQPV